MQTPYDTLIEQFAARFNVDQRIMQAIICQESGGDARAYRVERSYMNNPIVARDAAAWSRQWYGIPTAYTERVGRSTSWGLSQIMGQVAREHGFAERYLTTLGVVEVNLEWTATLLAKWMPRASSPEHLICMWNGGRGIKWPLAPSRDDLRAYLKKVQALCDDSPYHTSKASP
jgi:Transglycosylase SLT domain